MDETSISVEGKLPGGIWAKISGIDVSFHDFLLFCIMIMLGFLLAMIKQSDFDREKRYIDLQRQLAVLASSDSDARREYAFIIKSLTEMADEQRATTYVLTLNQLERERLKLQMPKSIRERLKPPQRAND